MRSEYISKLRENIGHMAILNPVVCLIIYKDGKILLQRRKDNDTWAIHGGAIEPGEKYIDALYREIKEELNIKPINPQFMGLYSGEELFVCYPNHDEVYSLAHVFICEDYEGEISFSDGEVKDVQWFELDDLPQNLFNVDIPVIKDVEKFVNDRKIIIN